MLGWLFETCASALGLTSKGRFWRIGLGSLVVLAIGAALAVRWGRVALVLPVVLINMAVLVAAQVAKARRRLWGAACLSHDKLRSLPSYSRHSVLLTPSALTIHRLADAILSARAGKYRDADHVLESIERERLAEEEVHLLEAVRALVSLEVGQTHRAAQQAILALPTGSDELDVCLGRTVVADAWNDAGRLRATVRAWHDAGVVEGADGPLPTLERLVRVRIEPKLIEELERAEALALSAEARVIGDDELATELEARARASAYR